MAENKGLQPLTGTEKQIVWATEVRNKLVPEISAVATRAIAALHANGDGPLAEAIDVAAGKALAQTSAAWWIDRRPRHDVRMCAEARIKEFLADLPEDQRDTAYDAVDDM